MNKEKRKKEPHTFFERIIKRRSDILDAVNETEREGGREGEEVYLEEV